MGSLDGRIAAITGAGRGIGREHALHFPQEGATVVVNDLGGGATGHGADAGPANEVVAAIEGIGGQAMASTDDVADSDGARRLIESTVAEFGPLDVLVNNAGILRDRTIANLSEAEWDSVIRVHLRGYFLPTNWTALHRRNGLGPDTICVRAW